MSLKSLFGKKYPKYPNMPKKADKYIEPERNHDGAADWLDRFEDAMDEDIGDLETQIEKDRREPKLNKIREGRERTMNEKKLLEEKNIRIKESVKYDDINFIRSEFNKLTHSEKREFGRLFWNGNAWGGENDPSEHNSERLHTTAVLANEIKQQFGISNDEKFVYTFDNHLLALYRMVAAKKAFIELNMTPINTFNEYEDQHGLSWLEYLQFEYDGRKDEYADEYYKSLSDEIRRIERTGIRNIYIYGNYTTGGRNKRSKTNKRRKTNKRSKTNKRRKTNKHRKTNKRSKTNKRCKTNKRRKTNKR